MTADAPVRVCLSRAPRSSEDVALTAKQHRLCTAAKHGQTDQCKACRKGTHTQDWKQGSRPAITDVRDAETKCQSYITAAKTESNRQKRSTPKVLIIGKKTEKTSTPKKKTEKQRTHRKNNPQEKIEKQRNG